MVFFVFCSGFRLSFSVELLPYSAAFAVTYAMANIGQILAIKYGSLAVTSLFMSYSLIIPTQYGIIFLNEHTGIGGYLGIVLLFASIFLLNSNGEKFRFSVKWLIFTCIGFLGNGLCATVQKMQQMAFYGEYKSEFMIIALAISAIALFIASSPSASTKTCSKYCLKYAIPCGLANGGVNLLIMTLTALMPSAILFPSVSAGGIAINFIIALLFYKEQLSKLQTAGYIVGLASVIILNI